MRQMAYLSILLVVVFSCKTESDFCSKNTSEKLQIFKPKLDSLLKSPLQPPILADYQKLMELENVAKTGITLDPLQEIFESGFSRNSSCLFRLEALGFLRTKSYMNGDEQGRYLESFIPLLQVDALGNISECHVIIKYNTGHPDTLKGNRYTSNLLSLINHEKIKRLKVQKSERKKQSEKEYDQRQIRYARERKAEEMKQKESQLIQEREERQKVRQLYKNSVSAEALTNLYQENEVRGDNYYKNKKITINGMVSNVQKRDGQILINLDGGNGYSLVSCIMRNENVASRIRSGNRIIVEGTCMGTDNLFKNNVYLANTEVLAY
jgi:hypothetical protein